LEYVLQFNPAVDEEVFMKNFDKEDEDTRVNILGQDTQRNSAGMRSPHEQTTDDLRSNHRAHADDKSPVKDPHKEGYAKNAETDRRE
jgi:hypothetical protein